MVATGFKAEGFKATGPRAASFTVRCFGEAAGFARWARLGEAMCFGDLPGFVELLKTSDSQPASLTSIGRSTNVAIAAMMMRRRGQTPKPDPANFLPDDSNPYFPQSDFLFALHDSVAAQDPYGDYERSVTGNKLPVGFGRMGQKNSLRATGYRSRRARAVRPCPIGACRLNPFAAS